MSLAGSQKMQMVGLGLANLMSIHQVQTGQVPPGRNGAAASMLKHGAYLRGNGVQLSGSDQQAAGALRGPPQSQSACSKLAHGDWPSRSFPFDQAQEEQLTTIHRLLHSAINNVDPNAAGIILDGTFFPFSAKCTPFQPGRAFLLPPEVEVRWDDSLPFPQKPVEQRVLVYYPAEKRVRWEAQTNGRKQVEGTALLVESRTYTLQLEKELCIKYEMRLSQDVLNFMQAKSSPTLISHLVRPFRMRASMFQSPEIALSVSSAGALHPDSTWQSRSGSSAETGVSRVSGTPPLEPSNAKAISNLFLFHRKLHTPEQSPSEVPPRFAKASMDAKPPLQNGVHGSGRSLDSNPPLFAQESRSRTVPLPMSRLQNGNHPSLLQAQVIVQPGMNGFRSEASADLNGSGGVGRPPSSHSRQTGSDSQGARGQNGLGGFHASQELNTLAPALVKVAEARLGVPEKPRGGANPQQVPAPGGGVNRPPPLGYTMDKISRLSSQQHSLLLQQAQLLQQQRHMQQQAQKPMPGFSSALSNMIPTPGYVPQQQPPAPPPSQSEEVKRPANKKSRGGAKSGTGKHAATSGPRQLSPANSAANSSAGSPPPPSPTMARNPSPITLPPAYDQNIPIAQLLKANRKKHKGENANGGSSPTASRDSLKQGQKLQRTTSSASGGSFLSGLSNPAPNHGSPSVPEAGSPRGREGGTMMPTAGLSMLRPNRPPHQPGPGTLPFLPTDTTSTGSLLDSPRFGNALTGRGQNGSFAAAARSGDSLQGLGGGNMVGSGPSHLGGGMQMIPTPGMMPTPGVNAAARSWDPNADLLSDLQSTGTHGGDRGAAHWSQQPSSFMDMLIEETGGAGLQDGGDPGPPEVADASADPFKEVLDSLDLDLFQEDGGLTPTEPGGAGDMLPASHDAGGDGAGFKDNRAGMELQMHQGKQNTSSVAGTPWLGALPSPVYPGAQLGFDGRYPTASSGLDHRAREQLVGGEGSLQPPYEHLQLDPSVRKAHASASYVSWDPNTSQEVAERTSTIASGLSITVPGQAQVDEMGLDTHGDPGLNGALDELMELDADFLDIDLDGGTFGGGIGEGDWSNLAGF